MKLAEEIKKSSLVVKGSKKSPHRLGFALKCVGDFFARLNVHAMATPAQNPDSCEQLSDISRRLLSDDRQVNEVQSRLQKFAYVALTTSNGSSVKPLGILVQKLLDTLHMCHDSFPVMLSDEESTHESMMIPLRYLEDQEPPSLELKFRRSPREKELRNYADVLQEPASEKTN
ncbi:hypothetical protein ACP70R_034852 [Stipagrostis hirtigluma subsp. patula]